jgi:hypothetical protein
MLRHTIWILFLGLMLGGCANDSTMKSSAGDVGDSAPGPTSSVPSQTMSGGAAVSAPTMSAAKAAEPNPRSTQSQSSKNRIAAGVEEETLDTCLAQIPQDGTVGQKMLAEQTCRRNFATRR